jgi:hypothetical protein
MGLPTHPFTGDIEAILFGRQDLFLKLSPSLGIPILAKNSML